MDALDLLKDNWKKVATILSLLFGTGGLGAYLKARSQTRNADKSADITALKETIETLQSSYGELQDRYQEILIESDAKNKELEERVKYLEIEYVKQEQEKLSLRERVRELERKLEKAQIKIEQLEEDLKKRDFQIMKLEQENLELRKETGKRCGLEAK